MFLCIVHNMVNKVCHDLTVKPLYVPIGFKESHKFIILPAAFFKDGHAFPVLLNAVFLFSDSSVIFLAEKLIKGEKIPVNISLSYKEFHDKALIVDEKGFHGFLKAFERFVNVFKN